MICVAGSSVFQDSPPKIETSYDQEKNVTTVKLPYIRIAENRDRYRSLDFSVFYTYPGQDKKTPADVRFELVSVVKGRKLNTDLYVLFIADAERLHFGSDRTAILKPVPGRIWIGERMIFHIPYDTFKRLAAAKHLSIRMGAVDFDLSEGAVASIRRFAETIEQK